MANNNIEILTTNIVVNKAEFDYSQLENKYKLVRYQIPDSFKTMLKIKKNAYFFLHSEYKEHFENPYYFYSYDRYNQKEDSEFALYALFEKNEIIKPLQFSFLNNEVANYQIINFDDKQLSTHILLKVLLANFFYNNSEKNRRICQSKFYIVGENLEKYKMKICVKLEISSFRNYNKIEEFNIIPRAVNFIKIAQENIKETDPKYNPYFESNIIKGGLEYIRQLKPSEVKNFNGEIWKIKSSNTKNRANLDWHTDTEGKQKNTRGYVTYQFQKKYVEYLQNLLGENAVKRKKITNAIKFKPKIKKTSIPGTSETGLPIRMLETIYVYDNRLKNPNKDETFSKISLNKYIGLFNEFSKENKLNVDFKSIMLNELSNLNFNKPVLILQDVTGTEFLSDEEESEQSNKFLAEFNDPYKEFYKKYTHFPKQSFNVNPITPFNRNGKPRYKADNYLEYFDYDIFDYKSTKSDREKIAVSLNELLLKNIIINRIPILNYNKPANQIPWISAQKGRKYIFMNSYTLLYIEDNIIKFADLTKKEGKQKRKELLEKKGIDWYSVVDKFEEKHFLKDKDEEKKETKWKNARFIFSDNLVIEIEEPEERILFNFEKGNKRNKETKAGMEKIHYSKEDTWYTVGSSTSLNMKIPRANLLRNFYIFQDNGNFDIEHLLETLSVTFVRNKQYTVYPFPFDLIRLYNEIRN